jgi:hypothetical protein
MGLVIYFGIFYLSGLAQWTVVKRMAREVNRHLPEGDQYVASVWTFSGRSARAPINEINIWRLHRQLYSESYLPWLDLAAWVLMIVFWLLCAQFDRSHSIAH